MNRNRHAVYDMILDRILRDVSVEQLCLGLTCTWCRTAEGIGFAQSPGTATRTLDFPGSVAGSRASRVAAWVRSWNPSEATVGLAAANAVINEAGNGKRQWDARNTRCQGQALVTLDRATGELQLLTCSNRVACQVIRAGDSMINSDWHPCSAWF